MVGVDNLVVLAYVLRVTTKKSSTFWSKNSAPPDKILATPMIDAGSLIDTQTVRAHYEAHTYTYKS